MCELLATRQVATFGRGCGTRHGSPNQTGRKWKIVVAREPRWDFTETTPSPVRETLLSDGSLDCLNYSIHSKLPPSPKARLTVLNYRYNKHPQPGLTGAPN